MLKYSTASTRSVDRVLILTSPPNMLIVCNQCAPPSTACSTAYFQYIYWMTTTAGQTCNQLIFDAHLAIDVSAQTQYSSICTG